MPPRATKSACERILVEPGAERRDDIGFLDRTTTPNPVEAISLLDTPAAWVEAPPWLGKSTVALALYDRSTLVVEGGVRMRRKLSLIGSHSDREIFPRWWEEWLADPEPRPALWILDGLDEAAGTSSQGLLIDVISSLEELDDLHRRALRFVAFTRPHPELSDILDQLRHIFRPLLGPRLSEFELGRLDRSTAETIVGTEDFPRVEEVVRRNQLASVAGYPIVLDFLRRHPDQTPISTADVWRGVLNELLGQSRFQSTRRFETHSGDRFEAVGRIAAVLTLTHLDTIRVSSISPREPTIGTLFDLDAESNRRQTAARESCETAAFLPLTEPGAYRFAHRNIRDWFAAFELSRLPVADLKTVLADGNGRLLPHLKEPARLIAVIAREPSVVGLIDEVAGGTMLPSDSLEPSLAEALDRLDRLEIEAGRSEYPLRLRSLDEKGVRRLGVPGFSHVLAERLRDPNRPAVAKRLLIEVAFGTRSVDAADPAMDLIVDRNEDRNLRVDATYFVCRYGGAVHIDRLARWVSDEAGWDEADGRVRGVIVFELLSRHLWTPWQAALNAPPSDRHSVDRRSLILHRVNETVTLEDARRILPHFRELLKRHSQSEYHRIPEFLNRSLALIRDQAVISQEDLQLLENIVEQLFGEEVFWEVVLELIEKLRHDLPIRRRLSLADAQFALYSKEDAKLRRVGLLADEDWAWLLTLARGDLATLPGIWEDVFFLSERAHAAGFVSDSDWKGLLEEFESRSPGMTQRIEGYRQRHRELQAQWQLQRERLRCREPEERPLEGVVEERLRRTDLNPLQRMRELAWNCFYPGLRDHAVKGEWNDLPVDTQAEVISACLAGLQSGSPAPLSNDRTVSGETLAEAAAFEQVLRAHDDRSWLNDEIIERWLGVALREISIDAMPDVVRLCHSVSPAATAEALLKVAQEQPRRGRALNLGGIPNEFWPGAIASHVARLVEDSALDARTRAELLELLDARVPGHDTSVILEWAARSVVEGPSDDLRVAAQNVLLRRSPEVVIKIIEDESEARGPLALQELHVLEGRHEAEAGWWKWPITLRERLAALLLRAQPYRADDETGAVHFGRDLSFLRNRVIDSIFAAPSEEQVPALDRLATVSPEMAERVQAHRAAEAASLVLAAPVVAITEPDAVAFETVRAILDRAQFRLIRSSDDLLDAVLFALEKIQENVGNDLAMLYSPPGKVRGTSGNRPREPLHEDALQAYLKLQLQYMLKQIAGKVDVALGREEQVSYRRRYDLRVVAPCLGNQKHASVIVEVKWSANPEVKEGLVEQLGQKYLLDEGNSHGVYVVGWSGRWKPGKRQKAATELMALKSYLSAQAADFCSPNGRGCGTRVVPVVLDLGWQPSTRPLD